MNAPFDKRATTNMTSKGQVLIPKDVRDAIGLIPGRSVDVGVNDRGEAVVVPSARKQGETPAQRVVRLMAALDRDREHPIFLGKTEDIMADLRGDDILP